MTQAGMTGLVLFDAEIGAPETLRRSGGSVWMESRVVVLGLTAGAVIELSRTEHLRFGYEMRASFSDGPVLQAGHAVLEAVGGEGREGGALLCRWALPLSAFGRERARLLHLGFLYEGLGRFEDWGHAGIWTVAGLGPREPFETYFSSFNADRV